MVVANRVTGLSHLFTSNFAEAERYLGVALANYDPVAHAGLANQFGQDIAVTVHISHAWTLLMPGQTRRAATHLEKAESLAKATGHIQTICYTLMVRLNLSLMSCDHSDVERCLNEVAPIAQEHNLALNLAFLPLTAAFVAASKGDKSSIEGYRRADAALAPTKLKLFIAASHVEVSRLALAMGLREDAAELAMMAQEVIEETGETYALSDMHRVQAAIAKAGDDTETAEKHLGTALNVARQQGGKLWELRAAIDLASLWRDQGKTAGAISLLQPVHDSIAKGDCPEDRTKAQALLTDLAGYRDFRRSA